MAPDPTLIERFARDLDALAGPLSPDARLGLAVSGGPDSLALLLLAHAALPGRVEAATVDHGLRPEAADETRAVAALCERLGVPHAALSVRIEDRHDGLQAEARRMRYAALGEWTRARGLAFLLTAHHLDDQAETLLMRLRRGSGVAGLSGVRARTAAPGGGAMVLRPLLRWRRAELATVVAAAGLVAADDPSNADPAFDRARLRAELAAVPWLDPEPIARSAAHLAQAEEALTWVTERLWHERARHDAGGWTLNAQDLPPEIARRLLANAVLSVGGSARPRGRELDGALVRLAKGGDVVLGLVLCRGGPVWRFTPAPRRRAGSLPRSETR